MYLVFDVYDDIKNGKIMDYKGLNELYLKELKEDTISNKDEYDILECNLNTLVDMVKNTRCLSVYELKELLVSFGWKIIDLLEIQRDLEDLKAYFTEEGSFNKVIEIINKGEKENGN